MHSRTKIEVVRTLFGTLPPEPDPVPRSFPRHRVGALQFMRGVRSEIGKVNWPQHSEISTYSIVTLLSVAVMTSLAFSLDVLFSNGLLRILSQR